MQAYSLFELNEYIKRVIALNFDEPIWIQAEISQYREVRGQAYLDLIQHEDQSETVIAQASAIIWYKSFLFIKKKLGELLTAILSEGSQVMVKVTVDFSERYGLKLFIEDIDASYTIGQMQLARQKIIERLKAAGVMHLNKQVDMPRVVQKVAIISSATAAGYQDFRKQLDDNPHGYIFQVTLFQAAMQGQNVENEVVDALKKIMLNNNFECVAIIRGGGSRIDLSFFDNYNIAYSISQMSIPVLVGIGHDIDESIADLVAYQSLKTPTAVANFLLDRALHFESDVLEVGNRIQKATQQLIVQQQLVLVNLTQKIQFTPKEIIRSKGEQLEFLRQQMKQRVKHRIDIEWEKLERMKSVVNLSDPQSILEKGFSIIKKNGKLISSSNFLERDDHIVITLADGQEKAKIL